MKENSEKPERIHWIALVFHGSIKVAWRDSISPFLTGCSTGTGSAFVAALPADTVPDCH